PARAGTTCRRPSPPCARRISTSTANSPTTGRRMRNGALLFATLATAVFGQSDPLVSKSVRLLADQERVWAFADGGLDYSRIDLFTDPPAISNGSLEFRSGIWGGAGRERSLLVFFNYLSPDTAKV